MESAPGTQRNPEFPQDPSDAKQDDKQGKNRGLKVAAMMAAIGGFLHLNGDHAPTTPETPVASASETVSALETKDLSPIDIPNVESVDPPTEASHAEGMPVNTSDAANKVPEITDTSAETFTIPLTEGTPNPEYSAPEAASATNLNSMSEPQGVEPSISASPLAESQNVGSVVSPEAVSITPEELTNKDQSPTASPESELDDGNR